MQLRSLIAGVGLVATTNALLLPPDLPIADDSVTTLPVPTEIDADVALSKVADTQTLDLECPGCFRVGRKHEKEIPSHLKLDFSIESTDGADRLTVNGYELYPNPDLLRNTLMAPVIPDMASRQVGAKPRLRGGMNRPQNNQRLGFAMETEAVATDDEEDLQLVNVEIQIIEVGDVFIERIPNVQVKLVKTPSGKLAIGTIDTIRSEVAGSPDGRKECSTTVCKWKAMFFEQLYRIFSFKGCDGSRPPPPPHGHHHGEHKHGHGPGPHHHPHPHPHHMGHRHGWGHGFRVFVTHILFPIMIGIVAGISASLIGMLVGTFIVFVWRLLFRRSSSRSSHRCRYARKVAKDENATSEEKSGLLNEHEDIEAPPAYAESNVTVVEDKKAENDA
ncbi:hypothetical protein F5Y09DRAFT_322120 [Xylaria sp. FL1042]|nr:hypothetical protein F5Y09DRAFT_322120 [Xylaria sp. FL1042]